ncbi:MAG: hypothetical protein Q9220_005822 [cf. Caloplaca sp. 1 TL-2023]
MRAWQFSSTSPTLEANLTYNESAIPPPSNNLKEGQCLIEVLSASLNPVDFKFPEAPIIGRFMVGKPASPGLDYCGRVHTPGPSSPLSPGQLVFGRLDAPTKFGVMGQYIVVPKDGMAPLPEGVNIDDGAAIGTAGLTAYQSIAPFVKADDHVFIHGGSGGTGTFGIQIAKALGCTVTTTCSTANVELCESLGADNVIDYKNVDVVSTLQSHGPRYNLVVDNVGTPSNLYYASNTFLKDGGRYMQVGGSLTFESIKNLLSRMLWPTVLGGGKHKFEFIGVVSKTEDFQQLGKWMKEGKLKAVIDEVFERERAPEGYRKLRTGRAKGKIVVRMGER